MFYLYELLITLTKTAHRDKSFDHRHLLTDANDFTAFMASRLNWAVWRLNFTIELLDMLITVQYKRQTSTRTSSDWGPNLLSISDTFRWTYKYIVNQYFQYIE